MRCCCVKFCRSGLLVWWSSAACCCRRGDVEQQWETVEFSETFPEVLAISCMWPGLFPLTWAVPTLRCSGFFFFSPVWNLVALFCQRALSTFRNFFFLLMLSNTFLITNSSFCPHSRRFLPLLLNIWNCVASKDWHLLFNANLFYILISNRQVGVLYWVASISSFIDLNSG